jgi:hypothetical protein
MERNTTMSTAQDQQRRSEFQCGIAAASVLRAMAMNYRTGHAWDALDERACSNAANEIDRLNSELEAARALPARGVDPMLDTPAGLEPVATIASIDEHGPCFGWHQHWANFPVGTKLYAAAPLQAMLEHAGAGRGAESEGKPPQTRMDTGAHPGAGLPPDQSPCRRNPFYNGPSNCLIGTVGCFVDPHRGRGRQPAAPATTEPQAPTTGAGSVTAGAAQKRTPLANEQVAKRGQVGAIHTEPGGKVCMLPAQYRQELEQRYAKGFRDAERAHGIK